MGRGVGPSDKCWLTLPLIAGDEVIGIVELVETRGPRAFTDEEIEAASAICHAAAMALTNARLFAREQAAHRETNILNEIARSTAASLDMDDIAAATARQLEHLVAFDGFALLLTTDGRVTRHRHRPGRRLSVRDRGLRRRRRGLRPAAAGRGHRRASICPTRARCRPITRPWPASRRWPSSRWSSEAGLIGALALVSRSEGAFDDLNRGLLTRVATQLSLAVTNARLYEEIKDMHLGNLKALSSALNAKDYYTLGHAARVAAYMVMLGEELGWSEALLESVEEAAYLHDIGKISISDRVLLKPGPPQRPRVGADAAAPGVQRRHHPAAVPRGPRPRRASPPRALRRRRLSRRPGGRGRSRWLARAMAVVDAYDAMSCRRPYKAALTYPGVPRRAGALPREPVRPGMVDAFLRVLQRVFERRNHGEPHRRRRPPTGSPASGTPPCTSREDEGGPEYARIAEVLREVRDANPPTRFLTTHCRIDKRYVIGVDPEEDEAERSHFGDEIFADDELPLVLEGHIPDVNILFADEFGVWVTGLAPIRDAEGNVVAAVVADLPAVEGPAGEALGADARQSFASMLQTAAVRLSRAEIDAITDALTGLYNHRYLHERLSEELAARARAGAAALGPLLRPRPLQGVQRPQRPQRRRRGAARGRAHHRAVGAQHRHRRPLRRRGVRRRPRRDGAPGSARRRRAHPGAPREQGDRTPAASRSR